MQLFAYLLSLTKQKKKHNSVCRGRIIGLKTLTTSYKQIGYINFLWRIFYLICLHLIPNIPFLTALNPNKTTTNRYFSIPYNFMYVFSFEMFHILSCKTSISGLCSYWKSYNKEHPWIIYNWTFRNWQLIMFRLYQKSIARTQLSRTMLILS